MSAFEKHRLAITQAFQAGFVSGANSLFPVEYENTKFEQPKTTWCRFSVRFGARELASVGTDYHRTVGFLYLQVFCAEGKGTKDARTAADKVAAIFDNLTIAINNPPGDVVFELANLTTVGRTPEGWNLNNVTVQFRADAYTENAFGVFAVDDSGGGEFPVDNA